MTFRNLLIGAGVLAAVAAPALADDFEWLNVEKYPTSLEETPWGWSAIRIDGFSTRVAAEDFELKEPTHLTRIEFWTCALTDNPLLGIDWYIFTGSAEGPPEKLLAKGVAVPTFNKDTGLTNTSFGTLYLQGSDVDLKLDTGHYFLAFRTVHSDDNKGHGSLTTIWQNGTSRGWWSFDLQADGTLTGPWVQMSVFNPNDHEWAFRLAGTTGASCYADCDGSGELDIDDFICFQTLFGLGDLGADCDGSGELDVDDFICFQTAYGVGCP